MKLEIEITDEMKARLEALAKSKGLSIEDIAKFILADALMTKKASTLGGIIDNILGNLEKFFPL